MAKFYEALDDKLIKFIKAQKIFFVATAAQETRINLSPKGMDSFHIINNKTLSFLNLTGSGNETAAHLIKDGRITVMMCSFDTAPLIFRIYGKGESIYPHDERWDKESSYFPEYAGTRQIIKIAIESIQTSCGYSIPFYEYKGERDTLVKWSEKKGPEGVKNYWEDNNVTSIDGLPTEIFKQQN
ncbi:MAG: hypothetical protein ACI9F2_000855 [Lysobacterales bacterium]|jgi:hypothetical protein